MTRFAACRVFGSERGIALPMALGIMLVLSISVVTVIEMTSSNQRAATRDRGKQRAAAIAEAGVHEAASIIANSATPGSSSALTPGTVTLEGGSASYSGTLSGNTWTLRATSTVPNPNAGGASVSQTVSAQLLVTAGTAITGNEAWNYVFSNTTATCFRLQNDFDVYASLYVQGNMCTQNDGDYRGPLLDVRGTLQQSNSADVGSVLSPVPLVRISGGCRLGSAGPFLTPCTPLQRVWATTFNTSPPALTKPALNAAYWRTNAKPGPSQYCTSGTFPGGPSAFTNSGNVLLTPGSSYDCTVTQGATTVGQIAWNNATSVLTVQGVIYFDGNLEFDGSFSGTYAGSGVIYGSMVNFRNAATLCAVAGCSAGTWDPNTALLVLVTTSASATAVSLSNAAKFQGAVYAAGGFRIRNSATMQGPVVAETIDVQNGGFISSWPSLGALLPGMPSNGGSSSTVSLVPGTWSG